jgi:hypothetical protein
VVLLIVATLPGCGSESPASSPAAGSSETTVTPSAAGPGSTPATTQSSFSTSSANPSASNASVSTTAPSASDGPKVLDPSVSGRPLKLADVFSTVGDWSEQRYDVADQSGVFALGVEVSCSYNSAPTASLELRLANRFSSLSFKVGQANNSETSDGALVVDVIANSTDKRDNRTVPFNKVQDFSIDVGSVGALKINFSLPCANSGSSSVIAVVEDMGVTAS